jgi:hypothetical protein
MEKSAEKTSETVKFESFNFVGFGGSFEGNLVESLFLGRF